MARYSGGILKIALKVLLELSLSLGDCEHTTESNVIRRATSTYTRPPFELGRTAHAKTSAARAHASVTLACPLGDVARKIGDAFRRRTVETRARELGRNAAFGARTRCK